MLRPQTSNQLQWSNLLDVAISSISHGDKLAARVPGLDIVGCLGLSLGGKLPMSWGPDSRTAGWWYLSTPSPASQPASHCVVPSWINKSWGELAASGDPVRPRTGLEGGQGSPSDPSSSKFQCCNLGTLSPCLPSQILWPSPQQPATTSFGVTDCSQPLTACSRPKALSHHNASAHPPPASHLAVPGSRPGPGKL